MFNAIKILYIEDDKVAAIYACKKLDKYGYVVDIARDGKEGLSKLEKNTYDLVAVDYLLPDMNGLQVLQVLAKNKLKIPIIMITGTGDEQIAVEAMKLGATDYLIKDIKNNYLELLPGIIKSELEKQKLKIKKQATEKALAHTLAELEIILDNSLLGIAFFDDGRTFIRVNRKLEEIFGYSENELKGCTTEILYSSPQNYKRIEKESFSIIKKGETYENEHQMRRKDGTLFLCRFLIKATYSTDLSNTYVWNLEDVTKQRQAVETMRLTATVFEVSTEGIIVTDAQNHIIMSNPAFTTITGYTAEEVLGKKPNMLKSGHHKAYFYEVMWKSLIETGRWRGEVWNRRKTGEIYLVWTSIAVLRNSKNQIIQHVGVFSDITQRKEAENLIWRQANYDALTDLPNRTLFTDRLSQAMRTSKREQNPLAVMFIDLDHFKWVNDNLGHEAGDKLLQETAKRLNTSVRDSDTVARLGGDEFTIILLQIDTISDVKIIAKRILDNFSEPFMINNQEIGIGASIGISFFPEHGDDVENLLKNADIAMYQAKEGGRNNFCFFEG